MSQVGAILVALRLWQQRKTGKEAETDDESFRQHIKKRIDEVGFVARCVLAYLWSLFSCTRLCSWLVTISEIRIIYLI